MEFYNDSPATTFFTDESVLLSGGREQDEVTREWTFTERVFYANYHFDDKSISLSIFDDVTRSYVLDPGYVKDYATAERLLRQVAKEYPKKIQVKSFLAKWKVFFAAMDGGAVAMGSRVTDFSESCDTCGDYNTDEFIFLYVPAVPGTALTEASLGLHWDFGCYGGMKISGVYEDVAESVTELALKMQDSTQDEYKDEVQVVIDTLSKVEDKTDSLSS
jgi:hypothetical protein